MILDKLLLNSVVCKKEIISIAADFCEDKRTVKLLMSEKNTLGNTGKNKNLVVWFCFVKIKLKWYTAGCIDFRDCLVPSSGFSFCWMGYAKWAELGDRCWKGETAESGARRGIWKGIEVGRWKVTFILILLLWMLVTYSFFLFQNLLDVHFNLVLLERNSYTDIYLKIFILAAAV